MTVKFHWKWNRASLATIGRRSAVVDVAMPIIGNLRFSGYFAWLFWLFVHVYFLIGFRNRFIVLMDWAWSYLTFNRTARVVAGQEKFESENARTEYVGADLKAIRSERV